MICFLSKILRPALLVVILFSFAATGMVSAQDEVFVRSEEPDQFDQIDRENQLLKYKIVPLDNPVYQFLNYLETTGKIESLPQAKPYTKIVILEMLEKVAIRFWLTGFEKKIVANYMSDFMRESNGLQLHKQETKNAFAVIGIGADATFRAGAGHLGTYSTSLIAKPYISGDVGDHFSFSASLGGAIERLAPDMFYQSYTRNGKVDFPNDSVGYSYLPYQFNYETLYPHVDLVDKTYGKPNITHEITEGMIYYTELSASWLDDLIQVSMNNQRRAWGHDIQNLVLSSTARRFPGIEFKIAPAPWLRYSLLVGSLFSSTSNSSEYKENIYGYDLGQMQNLLTLHLLEYTPAKWLQISASSSTIWWKRLELSNLMPFTFTHFSQLENGDFDNNAMSIDFAFKIPDTGKIWLSFYNDEFSFSKSGPLLKMPRNRYAWQVGFKTGLLAKSLPGTIATLKYTRLTPFVYTHYPETRINAYLDRPFDMTYTHDGFNLGFYLPPNSSELSLSFVNFSVPDLILSLDNKLITHGTNDLASSNEYQIYGDINHYQLGDVDNYPYMDFTKDGIYDWTVLSELKFDYKVRGGEKLNYFRVIGSLGFGGTWWVANSTGISSPGSRTIITGSLGVIIDI